MKTILWSVLYILGACWFWYYLCGNPFDEFALITDSQIATGTLASVHEDEQEDSRGRVSISDVGIYVFRVPSGREFRTKVKSKSGFLRDYEEVEYLPENPVVSRIRGTGSSTITDWLWRKVGLGLLLFVAFVAPGIVQLRAGFREIRNQRKGAA